jgi:uncharacterized protein YndB with AHSA1/START domain
LSRPTERLGKPFTITRRFDVPRELVWQTLTRLEHLGRWMSPAGMEPVPGSLELRIGMSEGWSESLDRLDRELQAMTVPRH